MFIGGLRRPGSIEGPAVRAADSDVEGASDSRVTITGDGLRCRRDAMEEEGPGYRGIGETRTVRSDIRGTMSRACQRSRDTSPLHPQKMHDQTMGALKIR